MALCLPIETEVTDIILFHELTHIVHKKTAGLENFWERPVGTLILEEVLATRISKYFIPKKRDEEYIEYSEGWLAHCKNNTYEIIKGVLSYLNDSSPESIMKFTFGDGTAGFEREAYYTGWVLVEALLDKGVSFEDMASVPKEQMPQYVQKVCKDLVESF